MTDKFEFLSFEDEINIKKEYELEKEAGNIDKDIITILDKLNSINGLATLYSCQGHIDKPKSYIVIKFSKEISIIIFKVIKHILKDFPNTRVDWNHSINCNQTENKKLHKTTVLRGDMDYAYMEKFYEMIKEKTH